MIQPAARPVNRRTRTTTCGICRLWESDPQLAMALEAVHEDDVPPLEPAREGDGR